ncbi:MAG: replication/maintenance protein RepL [Defluviitaleaceae bacterium]|nr:replication/maintenance protein RepL [Defluviitaleaceae bacterium]
MAKKRYITGAGEHYEEYYTKKFWKCYRKEFLDILKLIENQQLKIFIYICENVEPFTNRFIGTYKSMSKKNNVSQATISRMMKKLQEKNFIRKVHNGIWMVNPNVFMYGRDSVRELLSEKYYFGEGSEEFFQKRENERRNSASHNNKKDPAPVKE